jgi:hypothetical protein
MSGKVGWILLWLLVIAIGIEIGAGIYEARVLVPLWSSSPPESLIAYQSQSMPPDPGRKFWIFATPLVGLLSLANLFPAWRSTGARRRWWLLGAGLSLLVVIATFAYFVPTLIKLQRAAVLPGDEVIALITWWVRLNWLRAVVFFIGWLAVLRALSFGPPHALSRG